jgi:transcriptional regulator with XRE-family HTH domain
MMPDGCLTMAGYRGGFAANARTRRMKRISELRDGLKMTQRDLAERTGLSQPYISRMERGETDGVTLRALRLVADALGVDIMALLDGERDASEAIVLHAFRSAPPATQRMILRLARAAKALQPPSGE